MTGPRPNRRAEWREDAACREVPVDVFTPWDPGCRPSEMDPAKATEAKKVCAVCPVRAECLDDALADEDRHAVRGGLTPVERRGLSAVSACSQCGVAFPSAESLASHMRAHNAECGTVAGYHRHYRAGETPCEWCRAAQNDYRREWRQLGRRKARNVQPCGTAAGYKRHRRDGEEACVACKEANAEAGRLRKARAS